MADITMCKNWDCPMQDNCWRLLAPPNLMRQSYCDFKFDDADFESGGVGCDSYIAMDELNFRKNDD